MNKLVSKRMKNARLMNKLVNNKKNKNVLLMNKLVNNKRNKNARLMNRLVNNKKNKNARLMNKLVNNKKSKNARLMNKLVNNKKSKNVWLMNKLANNKRNRKNHSKLKHNLLQEILVVHITKIVPQLELPGKLLYIKDNQVMTHILIVMAMELHVKNSSKKEASSKLLFYCYI
ncbi:hypothetical protein BN2127_JRS4_00299 [Bacillus cereus]|nr:hypothetical protein BN2127_JRS4_00299 [Bacillus cereus]